MRSPSGGENTLYAGGWIVVPTWLILLNLIGSLTAVFCNLWAARNGEFRDRRRRTVVAFIALLYTLVYYQQLMTGPNSFWVNVGRFIGPIAWVAVWSYPPVKDTMIWRKTKTHLVETIESIRSAAKGTDDG